MGKTINLQEYLNNKSNLNINEWVDEQDFSDPVTIKETVRTILLYEKSFSKELTELMDVIVKKDKKYVESIDDHSEIITNIVKFIKSQKELSEMHGEMFNSISNTLGGHNLDIESISKRIDNLSK